MRVNTADSKEIIREKNNSLKFSFLILQIFKVGFPTSWVLFIVTIWQSGARHKTGNLT